MQIAMWVPYDERQLRRTAAVALRPQVRIIRVLGAVLTVVGLLLLALSGPIVIAAAAIVLGVVFMTVLGPFTAARAVAMQSAVIKDGFQMTLTDEWLTVVYPLAEARYRWAGVANVIETPEAWYMMLGKAQPLTVPKGPMTDAQRAEFTAFLAAEQQRQAGRAFLGRVR